MSYCLPAIALALTAAGTATTMAGQSKAKSAMNNRTMEELIRQKGIQQSANEEFAKSLAASGRGTADVQRQQGEQERLSGYEQAQSIPVGTQSAPLIGGNSAALTMQDAMTTTSSNKNRAKLGAYEKWQLDQAVKNLRSGQMQQIYGQQAQRSQNVLPLELQSASHAGDKLAGIGGLLGALGSVVSLGSTSGLTGTMTTAANAGANMYSGAGKTDPTAIYGMKY